MKRIIPLYVAPTPGALTPMGLMGAAPPALFGQEAIDRAIARAGAKLADGHGAVVVHLDNQGEFSASVVTRIGDHVTVEGAAVLDTSDGWKFDKEHLRVQGEIVISW